MVLLQYPSLAQISNCVCNSAQDAMDRNKKTRKSFPVDLILPSAIFEGIDTLERFICEINPYFSSSGNDFANM
jgi:hypothetical protein